MLGWERGVGISWFWVGSDKVWGLFCLFIFIIFCLVGDWVRLDICCLMEFRVKLVGWIFFMFW